VKVDVMLFSQALITHVQSILPPRKNFCIWSLFLSL